MSNLFYELENHSFKLRKLQGLNKKKKAKSCIQFAGSFDPFTIKTIYEHYEIIARNLKVYPTVTVYAEHYELDGGFSGLYNSNRHHIDMKAEYYVVSTLAHEMRHAFQFVYFPGLYDQESPSNAREYLASKVEQDAREYAWDFCYANQLMEEYNALIEHERTIQSVIQGRMKASSIGLSDSYFRKAHARQEAAEADARRTVIYYSMDEYNEFEEEDEEYEKYERKGGYIDDEIYMEYDESASFQREPKAKRGGCFQKFGQVLLAVIILFGVFIYLGEMDREAAKTGNAHQSTYLLQESDQKLIERKDLKGLSKEELRIARNEIYARHGFVFGKGDLQEYFQNQSWYQPDENYSDAGLSELEHKNVHTILQYEQSK